MRRFAVTMLLVLALPLVVGAAIAAETRKSAEPGKDPVAACTDMMQGSGATEDGKKAMREFMQSDRAPQAMANMVEMARRMGNGDVMLGMTRMMEMMGSMGGGKMGGQGGMMQPAQPGR
ncbi:MAG TPA: hypothetical protein VGT40_21055 [Methylomirabilota bacterium]|nr:hypothetical protein [Methylomirabilota bacterium]